MFWWKRFDTVYEGPYCIILNLFSGRHLCRNNNIQFQNLINRQCHKKTIFFLHPVTILTTVQVSLFSHVNFPIITYFNTILIRMTYKSKKVRETSENLRKNSKKHWKWRIKFKNLHFLKNVFWVACKISKNYCCSIRTFWHTCAG